MNNDIQINDHMIKLFNKINLIIHPSSFTYDIYAKYFPTYNFIRCYHPDYKYVKTVNCQQIKNNTINIFNPSRYTICKGSDIIDRLINKYQTYKSYNIKFFIINKYKNTNNCIGLEEYNEFEFFDWLEKYNINGLTYINNWAETWSYSLTKGLMSCLPIIYTSNGSYIERVEQTDNHFKITDDNYFEIFENMLDYIINNQHMFCEKILYPNEIHFPKLYDMIFRTD